MNMNPLVKTVPWTDDVVFGVFKHDPAVSLPKDIVKTCVRHMKARLKRNAT